MSDPVLRVDDLRVTFGTGPAAVQAVRGVSFEVGSGETVGIVGESGCGKSVTAMALLGLVDPPGRISGGSVWLCGRNMQAMTGAELRAVRGDTVSMVFQDPMTSLNPVFTIGRQLLDVQRAHGRSPDRGRAAELLTFLGIPDAARRLDDYPHQLSGGMRQRVMIAMALINEPVLLIADEPTTALDVTVQAQIIELIQDLNRRLGMAVLFVSHDMRVVAELCARVIVFYAGQMVESGPSAQVLHAPRHPYTAALLRSLPRPESGARRLDVIAGMPPALAPPPTGCAFAARCARRSERCVEDPPLVSTGNDGSLAACWHPHEVAG